MTRSVHAAGRLAAGLADRVLAGASRWFRATGWWLPPVLVTALAVALLGCPAEPEHDTAAEPPPAEAAGPGEVDEPVPPIPPAVGAEVGGPVAQEGATPGIDAASEPAQLPPPRFRMTEEDAAAVCEYLSSLPRKP